MPYKACPSCRQISYSAADNRIWFCPCCGEDLSAIALIKDERQIIGLRQRKKGLLFELNELKKKRTV